MENVAACTRCKLWARCNQYMLRRSPVQEDVNTRALDTEVYKKFFMALFQKFRHGINFTASVLALYTNTQSISYRGQSNEAELIYRKF